MTERMTEEGTFDPERIYQEPRPGTKAGFLATSGFSAIYFLFGLIWFFPQFFLTAVLYPFIAIGFAMGWGYLSKAEMGKYLLGAILAILVFIIVGGAIFLVILFAVLGDVVVNGG